MDVYCTYVCIYKYIFIHDFIHVYMYVYVNIYAYMHLRINMYIYMCVYGKYVSKRRISCIYIFIHVFVYIVLIRYKAHLLSHILHCPRQRRFEKRGHNKFGIYFSQNPLLCITMYAWRNFFNKCRIHIWTQIRDNTNSANIPQHPLWFITNYVWHKFCS